MYSNLCKQIYLTASYGTKNTIARTLLSVTRIDLRDAWRPVSTRGRESRRTRNSSLNTASSTSSGSQTLRLCGIGVGELIKSLRVGILPLIILLSSNECLPSIFLASSKSLLDITPSSLFLISLSLSLIILLILYSSIHENNSTQQ